MNGLEIALTDEMRRLYLGIPGTRRGQAVSNALHSVAPGLFAAMPDSVDPFYLDDNLPAFWDWFYTQPEVTR